MTKVFFFLLLCPFYLQAQFGLKAGVNFANVSKASSINSSSRSGFHIGGMLAPVSKSIISSRTELIFSRQGYSYSTGTTSGDVNLNYIQLGQMMSVNATKYLSILLGLQTAYLLSAKVDSVKSAPASSYESPGLMGLYNRGEIGYAVGVEGHPVAGLLIGARYNVSLSKLYKSFQTGQQPSFTAQDAKNNVVQVYAGWRFGKRY